MGRLDHSERQALIRRSFLFKDVPQPILERLAGLSVTKQLDRRETLFNRGDEGDALYAVVDGLVRIWVGSDSGKELTFSMMEPGDVFGEIALLEDVPRIATIVTRTPCLMLTLGRDSFEQILATAPDLRIAFEQMAAARRREAEPTP